MLLDSSLARCCSSSWQSDTEYYGSDHYRKDDLDGPLKAQEASPGRDGLTLEDSMRPFRRSLDLSIRIDRSNTNPRLGHQTSGPV